MEAWFCLMKKIFNLRCVMLTFKQELFRIIVNTTIEMRDTLLAALGTFHASILKLHSL